MATLGTAHTGAAVGRGGSSARAPIRQVPPRMMALRDRGSVAVMARATRNSAGGADEQRSASVATRPGDRTYINFTGFPFPLGPLFNRRTCRYEVEKGRVWTFEQEQGLGFTNVTTNTRMTVIKLSSGGLWVHAPIAPTRECIRLLKELDAPVEHIVLPTFGYEHKVFMGPFCRRFPKAQHWVTPGQWSWPINLPIEFFGVIKAKTLREGEVPWVEDIDMKILNPPSLGLADYVGFPEVAFFHRRSRSLLLTDSIIYVPLDPPEVIRSENLLNAATDNLIVQLSMKLVSGVDISGYELVDKVEDNAASRRKGWQRMALQVLFFGPDDIYSPESSFNAISNKVIVSPIVRKLVYNKIPAAVREWVDSIASDWNFRQVIPCHFAGPIPCSPREFRKAYDWLEAESAEFAAEVGPELNKQTQNVVPAKEGWFKLPAWLSAVKPRGVQQPRSTYFSFPEEDMKLLNGLNDLLLRIGVFRVTSK